MLSEITLVLLYIDPGIGSIALQILAASLLGAALFFHRTASQILRQVRLIFRRKGGEDSNGPGR